MNNNGIIFDLDGTLWDSSKPVVSAWNQALKKHPELQRQVTLEEIQGYMGKRIEEIGSIMFPAMPVEERNQLLYQCCREENVYLTEHGGYLYPSLIETLEELKSDYHLSIVSNCQDGYIQAFLQHHKLEHFFSDYEMSGRTGQNKGENIKRVISRNHLERSVYVGDTMGDFTASREAGIPFILANYGFGEVPAPDFCIESFQELTSLLPTIFNK